ncbi:MAG: glycerol-3-phosphate O-acyltransferase/dihydroxyacetone phosphate acyltransferase [Cyclobacteriaceae bacterium]
MIYRILKPILKVALAVFFKKIVVTGKEKLPNKGPLIIAVNHPNTFMDPLIVATLIQQQVGFLGNAGIFGNRVFDSVLRYFHVIPIYRKKDISADEKPDNKASFAACHRYFDKKGTILIFPEGTSHYELKLRDIKTGTARIALSFEELNHFEGDLKIIPISLDYSDSLQFRSMLSIEVSDSIMVRPYKQAYEADDVQAVTALTEEIRRSLAARIPHTSDKDQEGYLINAHRFYTTYCEPEADLYRNPKESLQLRRTLSRVLIRNQDQYSKLYEDVQLDLETYYELLHQQRVTPAFYTERFQKKPLLPIYMSYFLLFLSLLPVYLFGMFTNYLPYILPGKIFSWLKIDIEYKTSVALVVGLFVFPLMYAVELYLFYCFATDDWIVNAAFLLLLPVSGYVAMFYWTHLKRFKRLLTFNFFIADEAKAKVYTLRDQILAGITRVRKTLD